MTPSILILGKGGQLGDALSAYWGAEARQLGMDDVNFMDADFVSKLEKLTQGQTFKAVFNAAAYTQVDLSEGEGRDAAFRVNAEAVGELAAWCKKRGISLVHFSTDYVFDGSGTQKWKETDIPSPNNAYGESKHAGEKALAESGADYLIFRTSWLYDAYGKNFFNTMLRLFAEKESLNIVSDQVGAPTYVPHLARASSEALRAALGMAVFPDGLYHLCSAGETSWYGFAQAIFALATSHDSGQKSPIRCGRINPIATSEYPLPAKRPLNSRLDCAKAKQVFGVSMPLWEIGLKECFKEKYADSDVPDTGSQNNPAQSLRG